MAAHNGPQRVANALSARSKSSAAAHDCPAQPRMRLISASSPAGIAGAWLITRTAAALDACLNGSRTGGFSEDLQNFPFTLRGPQGPHLGQGNRTRPKTKTQEIAAEGRIYIAGRHSRHPPRQNGPGICKYTHRGRVPGVSHLTVPLPPAPPPSCHGHR